MLDPYQSPTFGNALLLHVDGAIGAMSLSKNGRDAVLAGRRGLFIIDLDDPFKTPRWLHHITSWEVADVQWSPHQYAKPLWCISTLNQKALLWDLSRTLNNALVNVLHSHLRAITDINFHPTDPEVLATCAVDTCIFLWDMRTPRRPVHQWSEWRAAACQVKWNHENPFEIASAHDSDIYIWDTRKGSLPVVKISRAHDTKINGLDFSAGSGRLISSLNDHTVKLWNLRGDEGVKSALSSTYTARTVNIFHSGASIDPAVVIHTDFPVARARPVPFGEEKACGIMPLRGGDDSIYIVNFDRQYQQSVANKETVHMEWNPDYTFEGNGRGACKDFLWRTRQDNYQGFAKRQSKDYQLVTWLLESRDLTLWPEDPAIYRLAAYNPVFDTHDLDELDSDIEVASLSFHKKKLHHRLFNYETYCIEPQATVGDFKGDPLLAITMYQILRRNRLTMSLLNHLDWISGVRLGRMGEGVDDESGPSNLGEEVSVVGHKFPKVRFEKISVSTGEIIVTLRGLVGGAQLKDELKEKDETRAGGENETTKPADDRMLKVEILSNQSEDGDSLQPSSTTGAPSTIIGHTTSTSAPIINTSIGNVEIEERGLVFIRMEVKFPKNYPHIEEIPDDLPPKQLLKFQKNNSIRFNIEETHEINKATKSDMISHLREIATFYTNRHKRFCLEPCLRYLIGEKVDLLDLIFEDENEIINEIGTEGWADDLIKTEELDFNLQKKTEAMITSPRIDDADDLEDDDDYEVMPRDADMQLLTDSLRKDFSLGESGIAIPKLGLQAPEFDLTPLPKGCGALWLPTGQLVCFFIPKKEEEEEENTLQTLNFFKFTDGGFSVNAGHHHHHHHHSHSRNQSKSDTLGEFETPANEAEDNESITGLSDSESYSSRSSSSSSRAGSFSSDESFANDLDEVLVNDMPLRLRIPGLYKSTVGVGGGMGSNQNRALLLHDTNNALLLQKKRQRKNTKRTNIVGIFDLRHLLPDSYDLACEYRVLGDLPENLASYNAQVALKHGFKEISDIWRILEQILIKDVVVNDMPIYYGPNGSNTKAEETKKGLLKLYDLYNNSALAKKDEEYGIGSRYRFFWGSHPFGHSWLINKIFEYFEVRGNRQMLAMLGCILYENLNNLKRPDSNMVVPIHTPYGVLPPVEQIRSNQRPDFDISCRGSSEDPNSLIRDFAMSRSQVSSYDGSSIKDSVLELDNYRKSTQSQDFDDYLPLKTNGKFVHRNASRRSTLQMSNLWQYPKNDHFKTHILNNKISNLSIQNNALRRQVPAPPIVDIQIMNAQDLDLYEDVYSNLLLSSQDVEKIKGYREQYADLLFLWGLPISRIKILKFNYSDKKRADNLKIKRISDEHKCGFGLRTLRVIIRKGQAWTPQSHPSKFCSLCGLLVVKRLVVCTNCEHILHADCGLLWWSNGDTEEQECPTGCGCKCLEHMI